MKVFGKYFRLSRDESGAVAITVTIIIMVLVTLIVTSFALVVRREQRQALDRQLSSQALYAAESAAQDVALAIRSGLLTGNINNCQDFKNPAAVNGLSFNNVIKDNVEYTCVLIDQDPPNLTYSSLDPIDGSFVVPVNSNGSPIQKIRISWQNVDGSVSFESGPRATEHALPQKSFPLNDRTTKTGVVRATIIPGFNGGSLTRDRLLSESQTMFLYPAAHSVSGQSGQVAYNPGDALGQVRPQQGAFVDGRCNAASTPKYCNVEINITNPQREFYLHIKPLYKKMSLDIEGFDASNQRVSLVGGQINIDVTGKAADVLRRVRMRIPYNDSSLQHNYGGFMPEAALETTDSICKKFEVDSAEVRNLCSSPTQTRSKSTSIAP